VKRLGMVSCDAYAAPLLLPGWARRVGGVSAGILLAIELVASAVRAGDDAPTPARTTPPEVCPTCPNCCQVVVEEGPRVGISINGDQWLVGGQLRASLPCLGNLGFGPVLVFGLGGNYLTMRSSGRLDYLFWFDDAHVFGAYSAVGASAFFYLPAGGFARFCNRVNLDECWGHDVGFEVGGGLRYKWLGVDGFLGFGGLPVVSVMAFGSFPLTRPEGP
jgi:hypothetical protein